MVTMWCLPTAPTNGGLGTCVSFMDQGSQCQFTCNNGYSLVGASTTCAGGSIVPQLCGRSCLPLVSMLNRWCWYMYIDIRTR